jgi:uncharacterized repeat protein (TIGR03803 family)
VVTIYQYGRGGVFTGVNPHGALLLASDGNFYGTTLLLSLNTLTGVQSGTGTIFKVSQDGQGYTQLHIFGDVTGTQAFDTSDTASSGAQYNAAFNADGITPRATLIEGTDGYLYGTAFSGGTNGTGTIYRVRKDASGFQVLHHFAGFQLAQNILVRNPDGDIINAEGAYPLARLLFAVDGKLYGTTTQGGANGTGTIFRLNADGTGFEVIKTFDASPAIITDTTDPNYGLIRKNGSGAYPQSGLIQSSTTNVLYGTTSTLGANGFGSVYSIGVDGSGFTVLRSFTGSDTTATGISPGANPSGELIFSNDGKIVGTFSSGGVLTDNVTAGTGGIYKMGLDGSTYSVLVTFSSDVTNSYNFGYAPTAGVIQTADGSYYGVTSAGGPYGLGTAFKFGTATTVGPIGTPVNPDTGAISPWLLIALLALLITTQRKKLWRLARLRLTHH